MNSQKDLEAFLQRRYKGIEADEYYPEEVEKLSWSNISLKSANLRDIRLGSGSFADVYLAQYEDKVGVHDVAVKLLNFDIGDEDDYSSTLKCALKEAQIISQLKKQLPSSDNVT
jgi:predicted unusual protein kinase regulating ubiquinone biosynthesis (AarF/ABC1/UbiB family)